jgi:hypothetical protein
MSIQLAHALARALNALVDGEMTEASLPNGARIGLETRLRELMSALELPRPQRVRAIVAQLATMPGRTESDPEKRRLEFEQYLAIVADVPEWALEWSVMAFLKNETGNAPFRPTAGEVRSFAMRRVEGVIAERQRIERVLRAKIAPPSKTIDPEKRKQLADLMRKAI